MYRFVGSSGLQFTIVIYFSIISQSEKFIMFMCTGQKGNVILHPMHVRCI